MKLSLPCKIARPSDKPLFFYHAHGNDLSRQRKIGVSQLNTSLQK